MNIVFLAENYPPSSGGVATSAQRVARELTRLNNDVQLFCFDHSLPIESDDYEICESDQGVSVHRIGPFFLKHANLSSDQIPEKVRASFRRRAFSQITKILSETDNPPDLLLSFYLLNAGFLGLYVARHFGIPMVAGVRGNDIGRNMFHVERFGVIQWVVQGAQKIACVNEHLRNRLVLAFPETASKSLVIPNGISLVPQTSTRIQARDSVARHTGWNDNDLRLVFIGTLREKKGVAPLLTAIKNAREKVNVNLLIVGPEIGNIEKYLCGEIWNELKNQGALYHTGQISRDEVKSWAMGADALIMPSLDDGMANGLLEGISIGLCPIVTEVFTDVVTHGVDGFVVPAGCAEALTDCILEAESNRETLTVRGSRAQENVQEFSVEQEGLRYMELFKSILS